MNKNMMDDELKKASPWLYEQQKQDDGFKVPESYFDSLEDRVLGRIEAAGLNREQPLAMRKKTARRVALPQMFMAAAAVLLLILAAVWLFQPVAVLEQPIASIDLSEEEIELYMLENMQDFETDQLAALPLELESEYQVPEMQPAPAKTPEIPEEIDPEDVEHILDDMTDEELEEIL